MRVFWPSIALLLPYFAGCGQKPLSSTGGVNIAGYTTAVRSGAKVLPIAVEMETLFPTADHFITHYGFDSAPKTWNTEVFFGGRYSLTMQIDVEIDYDQSQLTRAVTKPVLVLLEYKRVDLLADGRAQITFGRQEHLTADQWQKLYNANGDCKVLDLTLVPTPVNGFEEAVSQIRQDRLRVSLVH